MLQRIHHWLTGAGFIVLDSIGSENKIWLSLVGVLGNMPWGAAVPLV